MASNELDALLRALRDRDIPLNEDDVAWAFEGSQTRPGATKWVQEYLRPATFLTKDEFDLYANSSPAASDDANHITAIRNEDFRSRTLKMPLEGPYLMQRLKQQLTPWNPVRARLRDSARFWSHKSVLCEKSRPQMRLAVKPVLTTDQRSSPEKRRNWTSISMSYPRP